MPSLAARFAVKEAVMKALGVGLGAFGWADVEVVRAPGGAPRTLVVTGRAAVLAAGRAWPAGMFRSPTPRTVASAVVAAVA